jgi:glycine cleavage system transcriptional repressor
MIRRVVLTAIGDDRPGLVEQLSGFALERGANIEESRMLNMHGQFAIAVLLAGSGDVVVRVERELRELEEITGLAVRTTPVREPAASPRPTYRISARALDQPGIVHEVADALQRCAANIESIETTLEPAPVSGTPIFTMEIVVAPGDGLHEIEAALDAVCRRCDIDWSMSAVGS